MLNIKNILQKAVDFGASDVHINVGMRPVVRKNTELVKLELENVSDDSAKQMVLSMVGEEGFAKFANARDLDFSTTIESGHRFRVNAHYQRDTIALSFRIIPNVIPSIKDLNLPSIVEELTGLPRGLVLVTGHTGSGKSTSLASMVGVVNARYAKRIITLEDPVEYALKNDKCMIEQREIGLDCPDFASGLRYALRQDPDVIMVGEMRDLETTSSTITAAETGHLVFSTLHTINASQTIERIVDIYPGDQQNQIRTMLANTLQAVISQTLLPREDMPGMVPCTEILLCTSAVRNCIRENRIYEIPNIIETNRKIGMRTMDNSISEMYQKGFISASDAISRSVNSGRMQKIVDENKREAVGV